MKKRQRKTIVIGFLAYLGVLGVLVIIHAALNTGSHGIVGANQRNATYGTVPNVSVLFDEPPTTNVSQINFSTLAAEVRPNNGIVLDAHWGPWARTLVATNALNESALRLALNASGERLTASELNILNGSSTADIVLNRSDQEFVLIVMWSLGVNNNNSVINSGELMHYGGSPYGLASTGGYAPLGTLQLGKLNLMAMDAAEQNIVWAVANEVYRPCCDNPTSFPDCNHGAAALGLIELMAAQGANRTAVSDNLEEFNTFNFPAQYYETAIFFAAHGINWTAVPTGTVLGADFSSASGNAHVLQYLKKYNLLPYVGGGGADCGA